jgi:hypothetical protein
MTKKTGHDPELEMLLRAFREVHPTTTEKDRWRAAIAGEIRELSAPPPVAVPRASNIRRLVIRTAIQVGVAASLGFVIGAYFVERRYDQGQTMLFSQMEPTAMAARPPTTMDEEREVVRVNLDSGESQ